MSRRRFLLLVFLLGAAAPRATAQTASQRVTIVIEEVSVLSLSDDVTLRAAPSGVSQAPHAATVTTATYAFFSNGSGKKITGVFDRGDGTEMTLGVALAAPTTSGASEGVRILRDARAVDLVTGLAHVDEAGLGITYTASVADAAGSTEGPERVVTVTYTVTDS